VSLTKSVFVTQPSMFARLVTVKWSRGILLTEGIDEINRRTRTAE
jgi:hypothetical protein